MFRLGAYSFEKLQMCRENKIVDMFEYNVQYSHGDDEILETNSIFFSAQNIPYVIFAEIFIRAKFDKYKQRIQLKDILNSMKHVIIDNAETKGQDLIELLVTFINKHIGIQEVNCENVEAYLHCVVDALDLYICDVTNEGETYAVIKDISTYYHDFSSNKFVVGKISININNIRRILNDEVDIDE